MKHICFLMPAVGYLPCGGFKIVFEYANRFACDGIKVSIVFAASSFFRSLPIKQKIKAIIRYFMNKSPKRYTPYNWFDLDRRVKLYPVWCLNENFVPQADVYIATSAVTSIYLNNYKKIDNKNKIYFVQGYEVWHIGETALLQTYRYNLNKIVIAPWLYEKVKSVGEEATLIENGFDFDTFSKEIDFPQKDKYQAIMLYHTAKLKGCEDGIKAMYIVKKKFPQFKLILFGTPDSPTGLPSWITYYQRPDKETHNMIYNESAIFVGPSYSEGFCLTPPEAMQCGCAVACTNIGGYTVVAHHNETALLSEVGDINSLANNVIKLIADDELRYKIADNGYKNIQQYTWDRAYLKFKNAIIQQNN